SGLCLFAHTCPVCGSRGRRAIKNPRPFPAVGSCRDLFLRSTSRHSVADYDDYQCNLPNNSIHCGAQSSEREKSGQAEFPVHKNIVKMPAADVLPAVSVAKTSMRLLPKSP